MPVAVHVVDHPLIADSLTRVRDVATPNALFRQELERIGTLLIAEATAQPAHADGAGARRRSPRPRAAC